MGDFPDLGGLSGDQKQGSRCGRILSGAEFIAGHTPPVWLIDGIVQRSRLYACTSPTGHGKTAVWLFNACMVQAGRMIGQLETCCSDSISRPDNRCAATVCVDPVKFMLEVP